MKIVWKSFTVRSLCTKKNLKILNFHKILQMFSMLRVFLLVPVPYSYLVLYYSTVLYSNIQDQNIPSMILTSDILEIQFILLPKLAGMMWMHILHFEKG